MTDNTPRPEPMSREHVLTVLAEWNDFPTSVKREARAAVAALYDERDKYKLLWEQSEACSAEINKLRVERNTLKRAVFEKNSKLGTLRNFMRDAVPLLDNAIGYTGTEASDAEGGG